MTVKQTGALEETGAIEHYLDSPDASGLLSLNFGFARTRVLDAALELGVFTLLASESRGVTALAEALGCSRDGTGRLLAALVELGLLEETVAGHYTVTPASQTYLVQGSAGYLGQHFAEVMGQWKRWESLAEVVRSGCSAGDLGDLQTRGDHPGMFAGNFPLTIRLAHQVAKQMRVPARGRVLDLTAGAGEWGIALALHHPGVTCTAHDEPALLSVARARVEEFGLADRFSFVSANFAAPPFPDAHFDMVVLTQMGRFIGKEAAGQLLHECARMLRPGGRVLIADILKNPAGSLASSRSMLNLSLLVNTRRGRLLERSDYLDFLVDAGLQPEGEMAMGLVSVLTGTKSGEHTCEEL
ncbi:MAG: methyltransferase family protein [Pseudonocardiaceae bacterium]